MTDWLNKMLDSDAPAEVPEGFAESVMGELFSSPQIAADQPNPMSFMKAGGFAAAAALMLAVGIWIGQGSRPLSAPIDVQRDAEMAAVNIDSIYANHEMLDLFDLLEGDATAGTSQTSTSATLQDVDFALKMLTVEGEK
jgi:hypothetical protein